MIYNEEMFKQTLKAADLSTVSFAAPITWDEELLQYADKYLETMLGEEIPLRQCAGDADRYYYMMATHALYAAFCIANWEKLGSTRSAALDAVFSFDSIALLRLNWPSIDTDDVDWYASSVYDMAIGDFQNKYDQEYIVDNSNEYILGMLNAFFVIGYNLLPEYFQ